MLTGSDQNGTWLVSLLHSSDYVIRGWINYNGCYYKSALYPTLRHIDAKLAEWAYWKYKSLRQHRRRARHWVDGAARRQPNRFAHWPLLQGHGWTMGAG